MWKTATERERKKNWFILKVRVVNSIFFFCLPYTCLCVSIPFVGDLWRQLQMLRVQLNRVYCIRIRPHAQCCYFDGNPCYSNCHWAAWNTQTHTQNNAEPHRPALNWNRTTRKWTCSDSKIVDQKMIICFSVMNAVCWFSFIYLSNATNHRPHKETKLHRRRVHTKTQAKTKQIYTKPKTKK